MTFHVGVKAFIRKDNQYLFLHRLNSNSPYDLPGGRMKEGESPESALIRELNEELPGISEIEIVDIMSCKNTGWVLSDGNKLVLVVYYVRCKLPSPIVLSEEHTGYEWKELE